MVNVVFGSGISYGLLRTADLPDSVCDQASPLLEKNENFQDHGHAIEETILPQH